MRAHLVSGLISSSIFTIGMLTGCAADTGDGGASTNEDLSVIQIIPTISATAVAASGSSLTVSYVRTLALTPVTIAITGPSGAVSLAEQTLAGGRYGATFGGLAPCTSYRYSVNIGARALDAGQANTLSANGSPCPISERLPASRALTFRGVHHHNECGGELPKYSIYPEGTGWASATDGAITSIEVGYEHYYYPGSGLAPCPETFVSVYRNELTWDLTDLQVQRATSVVLTANYATLNESNPGPAACVSDIAYMLRASYPITESDAEYHSHAALPGPTESWGLERQGTTNGLTIAGGRIISDFTSLKHKTITAGFANAGDGFGTLNATNPGFAQDNNICLASITNIGLELQYADMPPNTPHECSIKISCSNAVATCDASPDKFELVRIMTDGTTSVIKTADMRATGGAPVMTDVGGGSIAGWKVCTTSSAGTVCTGQLKPTFGLCEIHLP